MAGLVVGVVSVAIMFIVIALMLFNMGKDE